MLIFKTQVQNTLFSKGTLGWRLFLLYIWESFLWIQFQIVRTCTINSITVAWLQGIFFPTSNFFFF